MALVVDASVGLKWVLPEADSRIAEALAVSGDELMVPDFWLDEACNVLWLQVRKNLFTVQEARDALGLLRAQLQPTPTADLGLHEVALDIGCAINHSTYDTLYVAFAIAMGAEKVVAADRTFARKMRAHPDPILAGMVLSLSEWGAAHGIGP